MNSSTIWILKLLEQLITIKCYGMIIDHTVWVNNIFGYIQALMVDEIAKNGSFELFVVFPFFLRFSSFFFRFKILKAHGCSGISCNTNLQLVIRTRQLSSTFSLHIFQDQSNFYGYSRLVLSQLICLQALQCIHCVTNWNRAHRS